LPAPELLALLKQAITGYFPGAHPDDDITIFIVERKFE
jgi:hypothetical protein